MRLQEYQSKQIFTRYQIPIPKGGIVSSGNEAKQIADELGGQVVIKSQVLVDGRGRSGGILLAKSSEEAEKLATQLLGMEIKGLPVNKVLVEKAAIIQSEIYIGITINRSEKQYALIASNEGGGNIEEVALLSSDQFTKINVNPLMGIQDHQVRYVAASIDLPRNYWRKFTKIIQDLWQVFIDCDATLVETNPLVVTSEQDLLALDAKIILDDNALFRHVNLAEMRDVDSEHALEVEARKYGLTYIRLDGNIGCMSNGAGLAMAVMDVIKMCGGKPANFLDLGGKVTSEKVMVGLKLLLDDENVHAILINIFENNHAFEEILQGIRQILGERNTSIPIVLRLSGMEPDKVEQNMVGLPIVPKDTLFEAAQTVISMTRVNSNEHSDK